MSPGPDLDETGQTGVSNFTAGGALAVLIVAVLSAVAHVFLGAPQ